LIARDIDIDIFEVVLASTSNSDAVNCHKELTSPQIRILSGGETVILSETETAEQVRVLSDD
jgi:hypothetical protein